MPIIENPSIKVLKSIIKKNRLTHADLKPELGSKSNVSLILSGKRNLTKGHIQKLSDRFNLQPSIFFNPQEANLFAGKKIKVPTVNLLDPDVEPDPKSMDALLYDVALKANSRAQKTHEALMENLNKAIKLVLPDGC